MRLLIGILGFLITSAFAEVYCIKEINNNTNEPYLSYAILRAVEQAILQSGGSIECVQDSKSLVVSVVSFRNIPIAYTPSQRVSAYNLSVRLHVRVNGRDFTLSGTVPYSVPSGTGDIPRRRAIDDLLDTIYWSLLENLRRR